MVFVNNSDNNRVGATNSGQTNTFTITNPSNTASSAARETITVGGGTAGDPTLNFNISGVTNFEMGIDNSDSDKLKIAQGTALGTNDVWRMTTAGIRTMPLQPAFLAYQNLDVNNVTGDGTDYTVICDVEEIDQGSNYNNATGVFTAPVTGVYQFNCSFSLINLSASHNSGAIRLSINSGVKLYNFFSLNWGAARNSLNGFLGSGSVNVTLSASDTVTMVVTIVGGTKTVGLQGLTAPVRDTFFSGVLLV